MKETLQKIADNTDRMVALLEQLLAQGEKPPGPGRFPAAKSAPVPKVSESVEIVKAAPRDVKLTPEAPSISAPQKLITNGMSDFEQLHTLVQSALWPEATDPDYICKTQSEEDKFDRAEGILDLLIDTNLENLSVLDFGCGEGHLAVKSLEQRPKKVVGFDIVPQWQKHGEVNSLTFTDDWERVKEQSPYNVVFLYDVLDHINNDNGGAIEALRRIRQVTAPGGRVYVRTHPWCGRHGGHLYSQMNKAFIHLVFSESELVEMGLTPGPYTRRIIHPLGSYQEYFTLSGFQLKHTQVTKEPVESFFSDTPVVARRIRMHWRDSRDPRLRDGTQFPGMQMEQQFLDYILA